MYMCHKQPCAINHFDHRCCPPFLNSLRQWHCCISCSSCSCRCISQLAKSSMSFLEILDSLLQLLVGSQSLGVMHEVNQADV